MRAYHPLLLNISYLMRISKLFILAVTVIALCGSFLPSALSSTNVDVINGANADVKYVYVDSIESASKSREANKNDGEDFGAFADLHEDTQYLYMGSEAKFDKLYFLIEQGLKADDVIYYDEEEDEERHDDEMELTWEYNNGGSWEELDLEKDETKDFSKTGNQSVKWDMPRDWEECSYEGKDAFWVRVRAEGNVKQGATIEQISAVIYNVSVSVKNDNGETMSNLAASNFDLGNGSDGRIYAFDEIDNGEYVLALQTEAPDTSYTLMVSVDGYNQYGLQLADVDEEMESYKIQLTPNTGCDAPFNDIDFHWAQTAIDALYCRGIIDDDNSSFGVNSSVTRAEFLKMAIMNADIDTEKYDQFDVPFRDVDCDDWFYDYVATAYHLDIIDEDNVYSPNSTITRVEALTILVRLAGIETDKTATRFSDVDSDDWYAAMVRVATDYDVVEGYPDGEFKPERILSRAEAAMMVNNAYSAWWEEM